MRERVTRCCPALHADSGNYRQREEQHEPLGAGMDITKSSSFVVGNALASVCWSCGGLPAQGESLASAWLR